MTIKKQLSRMPYSELLAFIECNDVIEGFDYEVDKDGVVLSLLTLTENKRNIIRLHQPMTLLLVRL